MAIALAIATAYALAAFDRPQVLGRGGGGLGSAIWPALTALLVAAVGAIWYRRTVLSRPFVLTAGVLAALFTVWTVTGMSFKHHGVACHWSNCAVGSATDFTPAAVIGFFALYYAAVASAVRAADRFAAGGAQAGSLDGGQGPGGKAGAAGAAGPLSAGAAAPSAGRPMGTPSSRALAAIRLRRAAPRDRDSLGARLSRFVKRHPFGAAASGIGVLWLPYWVVFFPGTYAFDGFRQLNEFLGYLDRTTHHPYMATTLMGGLFSAGKVFGVNGALFVYTVVQGALACLVFALTCSTAFRVASASGRGRVPLAAWGAALAFFALVPVFPIGATVVYKDYPYTLSVLVLVNVLVRAAVSRRVDIAGAALFAVGAFGAAAFRNDGIVIVVACAACLVVLLRRQRVRIVVAAGTVVGALALANAVVFPALGVAKYSNAEMLSVPLQQTARYLKVHGDEVTPAQWAVLQSLLKDGKRAEDLAGAYNPTLSDPVKNRFKSFDSEALKRYGGVWLEMLARHPGTYAEATVGNTYGYFWPTTKANVPPIQYPDLIHFRTGYWDATKTQLTRPDAGLDPNYPAALGPAREAAVKGAKALATAPVLGLVLAPASYFWVLLTAAALLIRRRRRWRALTPFVPAALVFLVCLASPVNSNLRYAFPYVVTVPLLVVYTLWALGGPSPGRPLASE